MPTFLAVYRGKTVAEATLIAVSADPTLVADVSARMLQQPGRPDSDADPVVASLERGRRRALRLVAREVGHGGA